MPSAAAHLVDTLQRLPLALAAALLPAPESHRMAARHQVDVALASALIGAAEAPLALYLFAFGGIAFATGQSDRIALLLLENWFEGLSNTHFRDAGLIGILAWFLHPLAWLFLLQSATGAVRLIAFAFHREPVGEPLVWVAVRLAGLLKRGADRGLEANRLGPWRPDRLQWDGRELEIVSCRRRPEWEEGGTLEVQARFVRLEDAGERRLGDRTAWVYHFTEVDETEVVRGLQTYRPLARPR